MEKPCPEEPPPIPTDQQDRGPLALLVLVLLFLSLAALRGAGCFSSSQAVPAAAPRLFWLEGAARPGLYQLPPNATMADLAGLAGLGGAAGPADRPLPLAGPGPVTALRLGPEPEGAVVLPRVPAKLAPLFFQPIPINEADAELLAFLPGIGPKLAARIIEERDRRGGFASVAELDAVEGIGPAKLELLAGEVVVE